MGILSYFERALKLERCDFTFWGTAPQTPPPPFPARMSINPWHFASSAQATRLINKPGYSTPQPPQLAKYLVIPKFEPRTQPTLALLLGQF